MVDFKRLGRSFTYAVEGIHFAFRSDQNLFIHVVIGTLVLILSIFFDVKPYEMGILGVTILVVISAEMVNSAIEKMVDLITKEHRQEAKIAKDVSAGMVLLTSVGSAVIGTLIFLPYILDLLQIKH